MTAGILHRTVTGDSGPVIVCLHAFASAGRAWQEVISELARNHRCVTLDLRGFGRSQGLPDAGSIADHVSDALDLLSAYQSDGYVLAGHSMGGKIAQAVAATRPRGLKGLLLVAPSPPSPEPMSETQRRQTLAAFGDEAAAAALVERISVRALSETSRAFFIADSLAASDGAWRWWLEHGSREDIEQAVRLIDAPVRIVIGTADPVISGEATRTRIAALLAGSTLIEIGGAGHLLPIEAGPELARYTADFAASIG